MVQVLRRRRANDPACRTGCAPINAIYTGNRLCLGNLGGLRLFWCGAHSPIAIASIGLGDYRNHLSSPRLPLILDADLPTGDCQFVLDLEFNHRPCLRVGVRSGCVARLANHVTSKLIAGGGWFGLPPSIAFANVRSAAGPPLTIEPKRRGSPANLARLPSQGLRALPGLNQGTQCRLAKGQSLADEVSRDTGPESSAKGG